MRSRPTRETAAEPARSAEAAGVGCRSETGRLERVLLADPRHAFASQDVIQNRWREFGFRGPPDFKQAVAEFDRFVDILNGFGVVVEYLTGTDRPGLDAIYARDASVVVGGGAVLGRMGKRQRQHEPSAHGQTFASLGVPILGSIGGSGLLEGGDVVWIDDNTLAVGSGYRTNPEGIRQLGVVLADGATDLSTVPLPHWRGPGSVLHLMSIFSPVDRDLALVYSPLMCVPFRETLLSRSIEIVDVPDDEFETLGANVLAVAPRRCVMLDGNPQTRARLEAKGVDVHVFAGNEICVKGDGGPTCLTRPLRRAHE